MAYERISKLFQLISADNGGCTADEIEEVLRGVGDDVLDIIASGEDTEQEVLKLALHEKYDRQFPGVVEVIFDMANLAFDG